MSFKALTVNTPAAEPAHILAEDDAALYAGIIGADCVLNEGSKMAASVISNNKVRVSDGVVMVEGHVGRILKGDYEDMTITNGVSGKKRNDLIVARFLAGSNGGADTFSLVVVQGAAGSTAVDPTVVKGNLYNGDKQRDLPLWRVKIEGLSIVKVEQLFEIGMTNKDLLNRCNSLKNDVDQLNGKTNALESQQALIPKVNAENSLGGDTFNKNFMASGNNEYRKSAYFNKPEADDSWQNFPNELKGKRWLGYREVYYMDKNRVLIKVIELFPTQGRIWSMLYNNGTWSGWKSITPI